MEPLVDISVRNLTSLAVVVTATVFIVELLKGWLASVPVLSRLPVWAYGGAVASVLVLIGNRVTGTLPGPLLELLLDGYLKGALASGLLEQMRAIRKPLSASTKAVEAKQDAEFAARMRNGSLAILLAAALASSACGGIQIGPNTPAPVNPAPTEDQVQATRAKAIEIAKAVESIGDLVIEARRATAVAFNAGLITQQQRDAVYQAIVDLEPKAHAVIEIARTVTAEPQLRATVTALMSLVDGLLADLGKGSGAMQTVSTAIRKALDIAAVYLGRETADAPPLALAALGGVL